jgi:hypothetical protein
MKTLITVVPKDPHLIGFPETEPKSRPKASEFIEILSGDASSQDLESFALSAFAPTGTIRGRRYSVEYRSLVLTVTGSRFCRRIGREHKSNGVYLVCRLSSGEIVQKCFDPDCGNWESPPVAIPDGLLEKAREKYENEFVGQTSQLPKKIGIDHPSVRDFLQSDSDPDVDL